MARARSSKGFLVPPAPESNISTERRSTWFEAATAGFVQPTPSNRRIYRIILEALWPENHGVPGPQLSEREIRAAVDEVRSREGKAPYKDVFRRLRELQGEEGFTCIIKEGVKYQLQSLEVEKKREPRTKLPKAAWKMIRAKYGYKCAHCGLQEPDVKLSPDHRVPRDRGGSKDLGNWQPLCEQCNNLKSSSCRGCNLNCQVCSWAYPETYKPIVISDENKEQLRRAAEKLGIHQSELANRIIQEHFNRER